MWYNLLIYAYNWYKLQISTATFPRPLLPYKANLLPQAVRVRILDELDNFFPFFSYFPCIILFFIFRFRAYRSLKDFSDIVKAPNHLSSFYKTPGVPGGPKHFSEVVESSECLTSLQIILCDFYKTPGVPIGLKHFSEGVEASECLTSLWIFLYDFYKTLECLEVLNIFLKV